jgi:hypothetical protein
LSSAEARRLKIYECLAYLSSSAQGLFVEPKEYGPLRCIDAMRRLIDLLMELKAVEGEEDVKGLKELKEELDKGIVLLMYSAEDFRRFVVDLNVKLAKKVHEAMKLDQP